MVSLIEYLFNTQIQKKGLPMADTENKSLLEQVRDIQDSVNVELNLGDDASGDVEVPEQAAEGKGKSMF